MIFFIKTYLNYRFWSDFPVYVRFAVLSVIFFLFISIIWKTVGKCSLLTVISIKDIRFAVETHPQSLFAVFGHFFFVYLNYFENCWEMFTFDGYKHQGHSICSRKPPSKFVIGAFFRLVMLFAVFGHFFFVYPNYFENCWEMFTFNGYKHQGHSICSRKPPSKFVIGAFFRLVMLYKETKKKFQKSINNSKNTYLFENSTIHR
ncbi:hypothetical protein AGLY_018056 [Aphis glycines]|uniref:Uncharacterized protein n=1 Tax=Aphis glycines TaxID=307491 RepID=A0A6G0ST44_APHGL|nr:hypothetical protein AGLY_018056 [Aphis glycines]